LAIGRLARVGMGPMIAPDVLALSPRWRHPPSFYCPISHQCMHDPVALSDGHSYERRHIEKWLTLHNTSPVSGVKLARPDAQAEPSSNVPLLQNIDSLMQCSLVVNGHLSIELVLRRIMEEAKSIVGAEVASVFLIDRTKKELYSTVNSTGAEIRIPMNGGIAGHVATTGEPVICNDVYSNNYFDSTVDVRTCFRTRNMICIPLKAEKKGVIGVVELINKVSTGLLSHEMVHATHNNKKRRNAEDPVFTESDQQFLTVFVLHAANAIASSGMLDEKLQAGRGLQLVVSPRRQRKTRMLCGNPQELLKKAAQAVRTGEILCKAYSSWQFDSLELSAMTHGRPLSTLGVYLFEQTGLVQHFDLDREKLNRFFLEIEQGYDDSNPYHNCAHAASVMHLMHALLEQGQLAQTIATSNAKRGEGDPSGQLERMACLIAAAVHDFEHRGLTNDFLVKTGDDQAIRYNDKHVNEQHHVAAAFHVLSRPECNFLEDLPSDDFRSLRSLAIELVLGTDMAKHRALTTSFTDVVNAASVPQNDQLECAPFIPGTREELVHLLQIVMKVADLGHLSLDWSLHCRWVHLLEEELFSQGDKEKQLGFPISFLMDRSKPGASATQVGFLEGVVCPLYNALVRTIPLAKPLLDGVKLNQLKWKEVEKFKGIAKKCASHL